MNKPHIYKWFGLWYVKCLYKGKHNKTTFAWTVWGCGEDPNLAWSHFLQNWDAVVNGQLEPAPIGEFG